MTQDIKPVSDMTESDKTTKHEEKQETNQNLKEDEKQDFQQEKQTDVKEVNPKSPQEHESPRRTNTGTIETLTQMRAKESPGGGHPAGTEQKPQESVAMSSQAQPAAGWTRADRPLSPDTQDPRAPHTPADAHRSQWAQTRPVSHQAHEEKQETDKKLKEDEKQDFQQVEKKPSINEVRKKFEINQHAAEEKLKEEHHHHLQKKHAEISNMKKEEENQEADKKFKKDDKKQDFKQEVKKTVVTGVVNPQNTREPETPKRTNKHTFVAMNQTRAKESPGWKHPAGTEQKPQESAAMSSQAQPAAGWTRADRPLSPDTQDPRAPHTPADAHRSQGVQARPSSRQEEKQEADKKMKEDKKQDFQQEKKQPSIKNVWKQFEEKQEAEKKMKEANEKQKEKKHAEISNMKKEPETSKLKTQRSFQEQNKSSSANNSSARGDIILDKVDTHGQYICLKNTSSENKLMGDWEVKLQVNETQPVTFKVETNFTLKAGERLTLHRVGAMSPYPDDAEMGWMGMTDWEFGDDLKISLISNTGEEHRLK